MEKNASVSANRSWLSFTREVAPDSTTAPLFIRNVAVSLMLMDHGSCSGRWICRGKEFVTEGQAGAIRFNPADGDEHVLVGSAGHQGARFSTLIIPAEVFESYANAEGFRRPTDLRMTVWPNDAAMQKCLRALTRPGVTSPGDGDGADRDEAARSLVLRIAELMDGVTPEWAADRSGFSSRTLAHLVAYLDSHLRIAPTAADMAVLVGISPGHFTRKFRHSTGLSLHRFVNRRRIQAALNMLKHQAVPLSHVAFDLGFASQSHFTQLFSKSIGMTPARYRRLFRPTVA